MTVNDSNMVGGDDPTINNDPTIEELYRQVNNLDVDYDLANEELTGYSKVVDEYEAELEKIRTEAETALRAVASKKAVIDTERRKAQRAAELAAREKERILAQIRVAEAAARERDNYLALDARWDALTASAYWREWAKDHQLSGAKKIVQNRKFILADTMGTGKTLTAAIALDMIRAATEDGWEEVTEGNWTNDYQEQIVRHGSAGKKVLWYCPGSIMKSAAREIKRWAKDRNIVIIGGSTRLERRTAIEMLDLIDADQYIVIANYEMTRRDTAFLKILGEPGRFDTIIIDEAHNIKNIESVAYQHIKSIVTNGEIPYVVPMTGTPLLNKPQELFALLSLVDPRNFNRLNDFLYTYCEQIYIGSGLRWVFKYGGADRLLKRMGHLYIRRTKRDAGFTLDEPNIINYDLEWDDDSYLEQQRVYKSMRDQAAIVMNSETGSGSYADNPLTLYLRLRQLATAPNGVVIKDAYGNPLETVGVKESIKLDTCINPVDESGIIPEVVQDEKILVFSQFTEVLDDLQDRCAQMGINAVIMDGRVPMNSRDAIVQDFVNDPAVRVLLCNYRVAGVGMDGLQKVASQMIIVDEEWNPGKRDQAYDRLNRFGQDKQVTVHLLRLANSIDTWMASLIESKEDMISGFNEKASSFNDDFRAGLSDGSI